MTLGVAATNYAVVATDTCVRMDGEVCDVGGKLRAVTRGFVAGTGVMGVAYPVLDALERSPVRDGGDLREVIRRVGSERVARVRAEHPDCEPEKTGFTAVLAEPDGLWAHLFSMEGQDLKRRRGVLFSGPHLTGSLDEAKARFMASLGAATALPGTLRAVLTFFAAAYASSDNMTRIIDAGLLLDGRRAWLKGDTGELLALDDDGLLAAIRKVPPAPPIICLV